MVRVSWMRAGVESGFVEVPGVVRVGVGAERERMRGPGPVRGPALFGRERGEGKEAILGGGTGLWSF